MMGGKYIAPCRLFYPLKIEQLAPEDFPSKKETIVLFQISGDMLVLGRYTHSSLNHEFWKCLGKFILMWVSLVSYRGVYFRVVDLTLNQSRQTLESQI